MEQEEKEWTSVTEGTMAHVERAEEMCKAANFETRLEEMSIEECRDCTGCFRQADEKMYRLWKRKK